MPPRPPPPPPPMTDEDRAREILLRLPPDDPGCLFRASLVSKPWRRLVTSPDFGRRYREFHRAPPLLGFFDYHVGFSLSFEPSSPTSPFLPMHPDNRDLFVLDCRHGLVLSRTPGPLWGDPAERLVVWDPVGRRQWEFPPPKFAAGTSDGSAVVLCAADGCDHLDCHGGRFLVTYVGTDYSVAHASVFSSETRTWSSVASYYPPEPNLEIWLTQPKPLVGNVVYFSCVVGSTILRFDYINLELSIIHGPDEGYAVLMKAEQDILGCATNHVSGLCLWSMETVPDGSMSWIQRRVVKVEKQLIRNVFNVIGFADGIGVFYLRTDLGILTVDLKSGGVKNIHSLRGFYIVPYMSFYTPDQARSITLPSTMASSSENVEAAQDDHYDLMQPHSSGQVGNEEGGRWEEVGNGEKEGEQQEDEASQELFNIGSEAFEGWNFVSAADCLRCSLGIRVARHGKLSPKCRDTYYRYGWALLRKAQTCYASKESSMQDLDLAWKMLHVARVIFEKCPGSSRDKVKILAALAKVSVQRRDDTDNSFITCFKALAILANLVEPYYRHIMNLSIHTCLTFKVPKSGDAKAISLWKSRIQNLKRATEGLLADKGDEASATAVGLEESSLPKDIQFVTNILLSALEKKLEGLEQAISTPLSEASSSQFSGSSNTMSMAETNRTTVCRCMKRANVEPIYDEPSPKKFAGVSGQHVQPGATPVSPPEGLKRSRPKRRTKPPGWLSSQVWDK